MFTGIIRAKGLVSLIEGRGGDKRLSIVSPELAWDEYEIGESISVNGVCLTAVEFTDEGFVTDVSNETLEVTALGNVSQGMSVNLEPSMSVGERLGGHLVSGHVDCVGTIRSRASDARSVRLKVGIAEEFGRFVAKKGSICVDGVSLTVNAVSADSFEVNIIPHTAEVTIIGEYAVGTAVNIEVDVVARYLERLITSGDDTGITKDFLRAHGYG